MFSVGNEVILTVIFRENQIYEQIILWYGNLQVIIILQVIADVSVNGVENYHNNKRKPLRRLFKC